MDAVQGLPQKQVLDSVYSDCFDFQYLRQPAKYLSDLLFRLGGQRQRLWQCSCNPGQIPDDCLVSHGSRHPADAAPDEEVWAHQDNLDYFGFDHYRFRLGLYEHGSGDDDLRRYCSCGHRMYLVLLLDYDLYG